MLVAARNLHLVDFLLRVVGEVLLRVVEVDLPSVEAVAHFSVVVEHRLVAVVEDLASVINYTCYCYDRKITSFELESICYYKRSQSCNLSIKPRKVIN